ncbi:hypothetical protein CONCODRAFT_7374 [Conidiobolus coronatus NRRL 28638]|uniref:Amidohydrolase-related domain-containing protein n=1 Tax=Conidiobolus coronatus (strain ATCC 28846 / CBS 209.66 / NRRL 28638) TaxID=796925 RepID=A0A137P538_CONC2|nr:hypothetical protein CONCODRAFT_7374 [Conidiobolus coronatus NRRL 28638]|eukprot:KXN70132.1 hypothetical protein CONCODRAFT_7374 [Conidiobolus coronatus NRRL 28638]
MSIPSQQSKVSQIVNQGTTSACYFGITHVEGQRGFIGKLCMDISSPDNYVENNEETLKGLAKLANEYHLPIQSHFAESRDEEEFTTSLYPSSHYRNVFEQVGLLGNKSGMAHCCYSGSVEFEALKGTEAGVAHCPTSNFFVGGLLNIRKCGRFSSSIIQNIHAVKSAANSRSVPVGFSVPSFNKWWTLSSLFGSRTVA